MFKEFKEFAMRGNVVDMAVGIIIGGAFGKIVSSLVKDVIMPPIGKLMGNVDFANLFINLGEQEFASLAEAQEAGAATINYGVFINTVLDFIIVAFAIFMVIRAMNKLKRKEEAPPAEPTTKECPQCLSSIPIKAVRCAHCTAQLSASS
jgi:large conductance mechanosensitive channel